MSDAEKDEISRLLVGARLAATGFDSFPTRLPTTLEEAYDIQSLSIERWPDTVAGWKVGGMSPDFSDRFTDERVVGPIFSRSVRRASAGQTLVAPVFAHGFAALEGEFVLETARELGRDDVSIDDSALTNAVANMYVGVEIASSPLVAINDIGPCAAVSDFGNNGGLIVGPAVPDWQHRALSSLQVIVHIDNTEVGNATAETIAGGPLQALRFLVERNVRRGMTVPTGTLVSTGAVSGVHEVAVGQSAVVNFPEFESIAIQVVAREPQR